MQAHLAHAHETTPVADYYRRYAGFLVGGRRMIYVNGLANAAIQPLPRQDPTFDWRTQELGICDGGAITYGVKYDIATGEFSHFALNGAI